MRKLFFLLTVLVLAMPTLGIVIQSLDTTPVKLSGTGDTQQIAQHYYGGYIATPSGSDYFYRQSSGNGTVSEYEYVIDDVIPDGEYTVAVTWATQNYAGAQMAMNIWATADAITNGRISFTGGSGHAWHSGFASDGGWLEGETLIGPDNWFTGIYSAENFPGSGNRIPYESVTINNMQAGDLSFVLADTSGAAYNRIGWDTLEFTLVPEPTTIVLLGIGALTMLRRRK